MASVTFSVPDKVKSEMKEFSWVNWSELAREEIIAQENAAEAFEKFKKLVSKSKLTEEDAKALADKVDEGMLRELRKRFRGL